MQDLDMAQKRALVAKKIQALRHEARNEAQSLLGEKYERGYDRSLTFDSLDTLEILLLLLWRHLQYYTEVRPAGSLIQASTPHITRLVTSMDAGSFRADVPGRLSTLLQRLDALDVVITIYTSHHTHADVDPLSQNTGSLTENGDWRFNRAYIEMICKRLRETTGLREPENNGQGAI
jgi:nuclear pore complex protein Nup205